MSLRDRMNIGESSSKSEVSAAPGRGAASGAMDVLTKPFAAALVLSAGFLAFVAWDQSHWWRVKEDYGFGWLVPLFVAFVVYDRWEKILAAAQACAKGEARAQGAGQWLLNIGAAAMLAGGVLMFLLGAFYRAGAGTSQPGTLAITMGVVGLVLPLLFFNAPVPSAASMNGVTWRRDARLQLVALFLFPVLVWLISAPMVSAVESQLKLFLLRKVVAVVSFVFDLLGLAIEQQGNVLVLPGGSVGVEDACSGIRSLTGCIFAGSFLAAVFLDRWWKKVALLVAAVALAFVTNLLRGLFLTGWAYRNGPQSIDGTVHDVAGYVVLGLTTVGLLCLLPVFNLNLGDDPEELETTSGRA